MKRYLLSILLCLCVIVGGGIYLSCGCGEAWASSIGDIEAEAETSDDPLQTYRDKLAEINENMENLENNIAAQENLISGLKSEIASIDAQLITVNEQLLAAQNAIDDTEVHINELDAAIKDAEVRLEERTALLEDRVRNVYVYGDISFWDVIFDTSSFEDFTTLFDMVEIIIAQDKSLANQIVEERAEIVADKEEMELYLQDLVVMQNEYYDMASDLKRLEQEKSGAIDEANMTIAEYEVFYASEQATAAAASEKIRELLASYGSTLSYGGSMIWPLPSPFGKDYITSSYGWRTHPVYGDQRFHSGIDIGADGGTPIFAVADGKIIFREYYGGYGYCIMIDHGSGIVSLYAHQNSFGEFAAGDYVVAGDVIGYVGTTGTSTGNHLHFEVRVNGETTDPLNYLNE